MKLEREMGVLFNISEESDFSKYFWVISAAEQLQWAAQHKKPCVSRQSTPFDVQVTVHHDIFL